MSQPRSYPHHMEATRQPATSNQHPTLAPTFLHSPTSSSLSASTTAPGVQHSSVLAVFASIAANDILLAKVQNLPVHSCHRMRGGRPQFSLYSRLSTLDSGHWSLTPCPEKNNACCCCCKWLYFGHFILQPWLDVVGCRLSVVLAGLFWPGCCSY